MKPPANSPWLTNAPASTVSQLPKAILSPTIPAECGISHTVGADLPLATGGARSSSSCSSTTSMNGEWRTSRRRSVAARTTPPSSMPDTGRRAIHRGRGDQDRGAGGDRRRHRRQAVGPLLPPGLRYVRQRQPRCPRAEHQGGGQRPAAVGRHEAAVRGAGAGLRHCAPSASRTRPSASSSSITWATSCKGKSGTPGARRAPFPADRPRVAPTRHPRSSCHAPSTGSSVPCPLPGRG